jgi:D-alanine-D-alanine ligase
MNSRFHTVAVIMGGPGAEREVSLRSGAAVSVALEQAGYQVVSLDIQEMGFTLPDEVEAVFPVVHGVFGEDGILQRRLEDLGIPYVGSRSWEMPKSFDKEVTHALLAAIGIPMAKCEVVTKDETCQMQVPLVLKAPRQGSSIGIEIVKRAEDLAGALERVRAYDERILVEEFVLGRECTVGILGETALPVVEICPAEGVYDYNAKYERNDTRYLCPAPLCDSVTEQMQEVALSAFKQLGGRHLGRVDFLLLEDGSSVVLELNPIPGFTATSLFPKAAAASGLDFSSLCAQIMEMAE